MNVSETNNPIKTKTTEAKRNKPQTQTPQNIHVHADSGVGVGGPSPGRMPRAVGCGVVGALSITRTASPRLQTKQNERQLKPTNQTETKQEMNDWN